ncbi:MAG: type IV pilus assembly protein PilW [Oleispira sp.]|jgi:type IV pilus assembly protein PilW
MKASKNQRPDHSLSSFKGFTLIELMITLVLSLMITYAIAQVLISSNRSSVTTDGMSQSQETGRFVMSYLANQVRQAGLDSLTDDNRTTSALINCSDPAFAGLVSVARPGVAANEVACTNDSALGDTQATINDAGTHGDRLAIAWIPPLPAGGETLIQDCTGTGGYVEDDIILNVFWVEPDGNGMNSLMCQGHTFNGTAITRSNPVQAIANGVESMNILYGEGIDPLPSSGERNVGKYVSAAASAAGGVTNWDRVYAIKVSILTRSITDVTNSTDLRRYVLLDAAPYLMTDAISRQVFTSTFVISNYQ